MIKQIIDGLQNVVAGLGTARDKSSYSQYSVVQPMTFMELDSIFRGSWLAKRIINSVAEDMVREWITVSCKDIDDFDFCDIEKPWKLKDKVLNALRWSRLYGGSAIVIGIKGLKLSDPLPDQLSPGQLQYLHVVDRWRLSISGVINSDIESPNFDYPETYVLANTGQEVHWSRIIRFEGQPLPYHAWIMTGRWGDSELQHVLDSVKDYDSVRAIIGTMLFEANVDVIVSPGMGELLTQKDGEQRVIKRFQTAALMKSINRTLILDEGETYEKKSNSFTNLSEVWARFIDDVAGAADIPVTRLFGQSPKGLNGTGDGELANYYDMVSSKQEGTIKHQMEKLVELILMNEGIYEEVTVEFNPLWQLSEKDQTEIDKTKADTDNIYYNMGVLTPKQVAQELLSNNTYSSLTSESIELLNELEEPIPTPAKLDNPTGEEDDVTNNQS